MKSHYQLIFSTILVGSMLFVHQVHAQFCSSKIRDRILIDKCICFAVPGIGWSFAIIDMPDYKKKAFDAAYLDAATNLMDRSMGANIIADSNRIIDKFYSKLEKKYPYMMLGRDEVIKVLNNLNLNGVKNGYCPLGIYAPSRLANLFFPDAKAHSYLENAAKMSQKEQDAIEAKRIRDEKNKPTENLYYHDLSEDEVIKKYLVK